MVEYFGAADLEAMLGGAGGVPVTLGEDSTVGTVDVADQELLQERGVGFTGKVTELRVPTGRLRHLAAEAIVEVDGVRFRVVQVRQEEDGAITSALVVPA